MTRRRLRRIVAKELGRKPRGGEERERGGKPRGGERHRVRARARRRRGRMTAFILGAGAGALAARAYLERPLPGSGTVTLADEQPGPLSTIMADLMKGLLKDPQKKALADGLNFSLAIQDLDNPDMAATLRFAGSDVKVSNGVAEDVDVYVGTELGLLLSLAGAGKGRQLLEWLRSENGRKVIEGVRKGRFRIRGAARRPLQMLRFQKLLTPAG